MTDETLGQILSGHRDPVSVSDLQSAFSALLADAEAHGGQLDPTRFWAFVTDLARGRGIADEIERAAIRLAAERLPEVERSTAGEKETAEAQMVFWKRMQWAYLSALLTRAGNLLPADFFAGAFKGVADNVLSGGRGGENMDLLGLGTQRGTEYDAYVRAARHQLVLAVKYRAALEGISETKAREALLPEIAPRTWAGWKREVARARGVPVKDVGRDAIAAAQGDGNPFFYALDADQIARLMKVGWRPNDVNGRPAPRSGRKTV